LRKELADIGGNNVSKNKIPTEEEFARAKAAMRQNDRGLSEVCERMLNRYKDEGVHKVFVFLSPHHREFGVYVFYRLDRQIAESDASGLSARIQVAVIDELVAVGRGSREELAVTFQFDSHEGVEREYGGDYFDRLR
jgi:hypothetical protein